MVCGLIMSEVSHALFAASSADRRALCPGSWRQERGLARVESSYARAGTEAHALLERCLKSGYRYVSQALHMEDEETVNGVQFALDYVYALMDSHEDAVLYTEMRVKFPSKVAPDDVWGTMDIGVYIPNLCRLYVCDYKHGAGVKVDVVNNRQLLVYGIAALDTLGIEGVAELVLVIIQPNCPHGDVIREWIIDAVFDLPPWYDLIEAETAACLAEDAMLSVGDKQCQFCSAKPVCPAVEKSLVTKAIAAFGSLPAVRPEVGADRQSTKVGKGHKGTKGSSADSQVAPVGKVEAIAKSLVEPQYIDLDRISDILAAKSLFVSWLDSVEDYAITQAQLGVSIPGFKLVAGNSRRLWQVGVDAVVERAVKLLGRKVDDREHAQLVEDFAPRKLVGIGEAERLFAKLIKLGIPNVTAKELKCLVEAQFFDLAPSLESGSRRLVPEADKRPAVDAVSSFQNLTVIPQAFKNE